MTPMDFRQQTGSPLRVSFKTPLVCRSWLIGNLDLISNLIQVALAFNWKAPIHYCSSDIDTYTLDLPLWTNLNLTLNWVGDILAWGPGSSLIKGKTQ